MKLRIDYDIPEKQIKAAIGHYLIQVLKPTKKSFISYLRNELAFHGTDFLFHESNRYQQSDFVDLFYRRWFF